MISALNAQAPGVALGFFSELRQQTVGFISDFEIDEPRHAADGGFWTWSLDMRIGVGLLSDCIGLPEDVGRHCRLMESRLFLMAVDRMRRNASLPPLHGIDEAHIWMRSHDYMKDELDACRKDLKQLIPVRLHAEGGDNGTLLRLLLFHPAHVEHVLARKEIGKDAVQELPAALDDLFGKLLDPA